MAKHLWTALEIWCTNPKTGHAPLLVAPIERVKRQIRIEAQFAEMNTAYEC